MSDKHGKPGKLFSLYARDTTGAMLFCADLEINEDVSNKEAMQRLMDECWDPKLDTAACRPVLLRIR